MPCSSRVRSAALRPRNVLSLVPFVLFIGSAGPAGAHLSIIRQAHEAAGAFEAGDRTGGALAAGDFDGDGRDDLAMGAPGEDVEGFVDAGAVIVSWGSPTGISHIGSSALTAANSGGALQGGGEFGSALLAGDWNNDGFDDLAIGCPRDDLGLGIREAGMVYLLRGTPNGLEPWIQLDQADGGGSRETGDLFAFSLGSGDFNGDGRIDLAVGSPGEDGLRGAVFYFLNSSIGVPFGGSGWFKSSSLGFPGSSGDAFGFSLAGGGFSGGAEDDLAVGVPGADDIAPNTGAFWILRGGPGGLTASAAVLYTGWDLSGGVEDGARLGHSLAAGRLFGGSFDALAVAAPFADHSTREDAGEVFVCPGGAEGLVVASTVRLRGQQPVDAEAFGLALAAGTFRAPDPGFEDLAVGLPGRTEALLDSAGEVRVFHGSSQGPSAAGAEAFDQSQLGDAMAAGAQFGLALAFGRFDGSASGAMAAGAPGMENDAGQVHVIAPWRQALRISCRHSVAYDCEGTLVFSQKPFDRVGIASTTKTMTVLLAAERGQLPPSDPRHVPLDREYTVPNWVADDIPGSQVPLVAGERMTLLDLMYTCMLRSGNDAANAIADLLYGGAGPSIAVPLFVAEMNARAAELGMTGTHFHNPAGLDNEPVGPELGEHYSTPVDMALLSRAAVENPLVAEIVATTSHPMVRHYPGPGGFFFVDEAWTCDNIFAGVLQNGIEPATGIKGGWTPGAQVTGLFSARSPEGGTAIAGTYRLPQGQGQAYVTDAARLLEVGLAECNAPLVFSPQSFPFLRHYPDIPALEGVRTGGGAEFPIDLARGVAFSLFRQSGESTIRAGLEVGRSMEAVVAAGGTISVGVSPFQSHGGFRIANTGSHAVDLLLRADYPSGFGIAVSLGPGEWKVIEPETSAEPLPGYALSITNDSAAGLDAHLSVEESYAFRPEIPGAAQPGAFEVVLRRDGDPEGDGFWWRVTGGDPDGDGTLLVSVHEEGTVVSVPEDEPATVVSQLLSGATATPNPFTHGTRIEFDLAAAAEVSLQIYDAQGREVRSAPPRELPAGRWSVDWDGRDSGGERAPAGVYFYRFRRDGRPEGGGKVVLTH